MIEHSMLFSSVLHSLIIENTLAIVYYKSEALNDAQPFNMLNQFLRAFHSHK